MIGDTKYKEEYKDMLIASAKRNETVQRFCSDIGISTRTFYNWVKNVEGWRETTEIAMTIRQAIFFDEAYKQVWSFRANHYLASLFAHHLGLSVEKKVDDEDEKDGDEKKINKIISNTLKSVSDIFKKDEN